VQRRLFHGLTIKTALVLGFGATFGLWLFAGFHFASRISDVQREAATVNTRYMQAQELLSTVRTQVLLGSVYVRDALLDPDEATISDYRAHFDETYRVAIETLDRYVPVLDTAAERQRIAGLRRELIEFRTTSLDVLATDRKAWATQARVLISRRVMPRRDAVLRVSDEVQALNRTSFVDQRRAMADLYGSTQQRIWQRLGVALAASLAIAVLATFYVGRLEQDLRRQRSKEQQNSQDLQRLSAKLVTAQEEERRTIARELHDEVGQLLMAVKVELAVVRRAADPGNAARALDDAQAISDTALNTIRDLSRLLHPSLLDDLGLPAAVEWYLNGFGKRHDLRVEVLHERMDERLAPEIEAAAYRIVQEASTNVAKHAHATTCRVYLQRLPNTVLITIEDDGEGFDPTQRPGETASRGLGLIGIRERVVQLAGSIRVESGVGRGTRLTVELPARARVAGAENDEQGAPSAAVFGAREVSRG
jgi:signal transduction histidine kinase